MAGSKPIVVFLSLEDDVTAVYRYRLEDECGDYQMIAVADVEEAAPHLSSANLVVLPIFHAGYMLPCIFFFKHLVEEGFAFPVLLIVPRYLEILPGVTTLGVKYPHVLRWMKDVAGCITSSDEFLAKVEEAIAMSGQPSVASLR